jgi:hypothetical protein
MVTRRLTVPTKDHVLTFDLLKKMTTLPNLSDGDAL